MNFQIETTSFCNLTCPECPNHTMVRPRTLMSKEVWDTILHKYVVPYKHINTHISQPTLIPHKDGEPLINKKLKDYLKSASVLVPDLAISVYTHGLLLRRSFIEFLGSLPNPIRLLVSFHFKNHDGTDNDYTETSHTLRECVHQYLPRNVELIFVSHVVGDMTLDRLHEWKAGWRGEEATGRLTVHVNTHINPWTGRIEGTYCHNRCMYDDFGSMFFGATGNVVACCMDLEEEIVFGNVLTHPPEEMYAAVETFYAGQRRREVKHAVCRNCFGLPPAAGLLQVGTRL